MDGFVTDINNYKYLIQKLSELTQKYPIQRIPDFIFKSLDKISNQFKFIQEIHKTLPDSRKITEKKTVQLQYDVDNIYKQIEDLPECALSKLFLYQREGILFACQQNCRVLIGDEMGLGKTAQGICASYLFRNEGQVLIICPASLQYNWRNELKFWLGLTFADIQIVDTMKTELRKDVEFIIISFDKAIKKISEFEKLNINVIMIDEAHYLKNIQAKRTQILVPFIQKSKHIILLTGTPSLGRPKELFNIVSIIRPDVFRNFFEFANRYCDPKRTNFGMDYDGSSNEQELHFILKDNIMIRRLKKDVLKQLPPKVRQKVEIETDKKITDQIKKLESQLSDKQKQNFFDKAAKPKQDAGDDNEETDDRNVYSIIMECYKLTAEAKIQGSIGYISDLLENPDMKFIVFGHHKLMLDSLQEFANKKKIEFIRIDGSVQSEQRQSLVDKFQNVQNVRLAILSIEAAGVGLTLTASSNIIFTEMRWTPSLMYQAEDRAHRIGQKSSVTCHYLIGSRTLDDRLYRCLDKKTEVVTSILDGKKQNIQMQDKKIKARDASTRLITKYLEKQEYFSEDEELSIDQKAENFIAELMLSSEKKKKQMEIKEEKQFLVSQIQTQFSQQNSQLDQSIAQEKKQSKSNKKSKKKNNNVLLDDTVNESKNNQSVDNLLDFALKLCEDSENSEEQNENKNLNDHNQKLKEKEKKHKKNEKKIQNQKHEKKEKKKKEKKEKEKQVQDLNDSIKELDINDYDIINQKETNQDNNIQLNNLSFQLQNSQFAQENDNESNEIQNVEEKEEMEIEEPQNINQECMTLSQKREAAIKDFQKYLSAPIEQKRKEFQKNKQNPKKSQKQINQQLEQQEEKPNNQQQQQNQKQDDTEIQEKKQKEKKENKLDRSFQKNDITYDYIDQNSQMLTINNSQIKQKKIQNKNKFNQDTMKHENIQDITEQQQKQQSQQCQSQNNISLENNEKNENENENQEQDQQKEQEEEYIDPKKRLEMERQKLINDFLNYKSIPIEQKRKEFKKRQQKEKLEKEKEEMLQKQKEMEEQSQLQNEQKTVQKEDIKNTDQENQENNENIQKQNQEKIEIENENEIQSVKKQKDKKQKSTEKKQKLQDMSEDSDEEKKKEKKQKSSKKKSNKNKEIIQDQENTEVTKKIKKSKKNNKENKKKQKQENTTESDNSENENKENLDYKQENKKKGKFDQYKEEKERKKLQQERQKQLDKLNEEAESELQKNKKLDTFLKTKNKQNKVIDKVIDSTIKLKDKKKKKEKIVNKLKFCTAEQTKEYLSQSCCYENELSMEQESQLQMQQNLSQMDQFLCDTSINSITTKSRNKNKSKVNKLNLKFNSKKEQSQSCNFSILDELHLQEQNDKEKQEKVKLNIAYDKEREKQEKNQKIFNQQQDLNQSQIEEQQDDSKDYKVQLNTQNILGDLLSQTKQKLQKKTEEIIQLKNQKQQEILDLQEKERQEQERLKKKQEQLKEFKKNPKKKGKFVSKNKRKLIGEISDFDMTQNSYSQIMYQENENSKNSQNNNNNSQNNNNNSQIEQEDEKNCNKTFLNQSVLQEINKPFEDFKIQNNEQKKQESIQKNCNNLNNILQECSLEIVTQEKLKNNQQNLDENDEYTEQIYDVIRLRFRF